MGSMRTERNDQISALYGGTAPNLSWFGKMKNRGVALESHQAWMN